MTILSLLLCLATAGVWVRSYWVNFRLQQASRIEPWQIREVVIGQGRIVWLRSAYANEQPPWGSFELFVGDETVSPYTRPIEDDWPGLNSHRFARWGFAAMDEEGETFGGRARFTAAMVPMWCAIVPFLILPTPWCWRTIVHCRRGRRGLCLACGYDLRATPERCPECGTVVRADSNSARVF